MKPFLQRSNRPAHYEEAGLPGEVDMGNAFPCLSLGRVPVPQGKRMHV